MTQVIPEETNLIGKNLLAERVRPGWYSVIAAMAAGISGAIALVPLRGSQKYHKGITSEVRNQKY